MKKIYVALPFAFLAFLATGIILWFQSPYIFADSLVTAIGANDYPKLRKVVDIQTFRGDALESMAQSIPAALRQLAKQGMKGPNADAIGKIAGVMFSKYAVSPEGICSLLNGRGVLPPDVLAKIPDELLFRRTMVASYQYGSTFDLFEIKFVSKETGEEANVLLARSGWFLWKAIRIEVKPSLYLPFKTP